MLHYNGSVLHSFASRCSVVGGVVPFWFSRKDAKARRRRNWNSVLGFRASAWFGGVQIFLEYRSAEFSSSWEKVWAMAWEKEFMTTRDKGRQLGFFNRECVRATRSGNIRMRGVHIVSCARL